MFRRVIRLAFIGAAATGGYTLANNLNKQSPVSTFAPPRTLYTSSVHLSPTISPNGYHGQLTIEQHIDQNSTLIHGELQKKTGIVNNNHKNKLQTVAPSAHHHHTYPSAVRLLVLPTEQSPESSASINQLVGVSAEGKIVHRMQGVSDVNGRIMLVKNEKDQVLAQGIVEEVLKPGQRLV